jgi:F0F1-type ATP synthase assembly protein I
MTRPNKSGSRFDGQESGRRYRAIGYLTAVPFILLFGPLIGYFAGEWLDRRFDTAPYLMVLMIVLGFVAAGKEVWSLIQKASRESEDPKR